MNKPNTIIIQAADLDETQIANLKHIVGHFYPRTPESDGISGDEPMSEAEKAHKAEQKQALIEHTGIEVAGWLGSKVHLKLERTATGDTAAADETAIHCDLAPLFTPLNDPEHGATITIEGNHAEMFAGSVLDTLSTMVQRHHG